MNPLTILAIHAHPDDIEILAGGTVAELAARGHRVVIATMTVGDCGSTEYSGEELARIRQEEARKAAASIGAEYVCAGFHDLVVFNDDPSRRRVAEVLRRVQPQIVITSSPNDYHCDHEATSLLVRDACFAAPAPNYSTGSAAPMKAIPHLYYCDSEEGVDREGRLMLPHFVVDINARMQTKREMLACHASQRNWLKQHHGMEDYIETMEQWTRARGALAKLEFGEGFRQYTRHPYPASPLLQDLLGGLVTKLD